MQPFKETIDDNEKAEEQFNFSTSIQFKSHLGWSCEEQNGNQWENPGIKKCVNFRQRIFAVQKKVKSHWFSIKSNFHPNLDF